MNSKLGEEQKKKKGHHVRRSPNFDSNLDTKQKKGQNNNGVMLGLGRVLVLPYYSAEYSDSTRHIPTKDHDLCYYCYITMDELLNPEIDERLVLYECTFV